jgi:hypothetical protein
MDDNISSSIMNRITNFKFQLIINKNLYLDNVITKEDYELVENNLLDKINILYNDLGIGI